MKPTDFIDFATKLANNAGGAAEYRSAASRAYYGVFNLAMSYLNDMSHYFPKSQSKKSKHEWLQVTLIDCGVSEAEELGKLLQLSQYDRTKADYDLDKLEMDDQAFAVKCTKRAARIQSKIDDCSKGDLPARINTGITALRRVKREIP